MSLQHLSCRECKRRRDITCFNVNQWAAPIGSSICIDCKTIDLQNKKILERENKSETAEFDDENLEKPFAEGGFRLAVLGTYKGGQRDGKPCVCKWFKTGLVFEDIYYDLDIKAMHKACDIIKEWNKRQYIDKPVRINIPEVWTFDESCSDKWKWSKVLIEPYIKNYTKYNSSSGWRSKYESSWHRAMQALSHFSYHNSNGEYVLCDLQGGVYSNAVILTDPVILSRTKKFGISDLGPRGISSFFSCHECNEFCKSHWLLPVNSTRYYEPKQGTSMSSAGTGARLHVTTGISKSKRQRTSDRVAFPDPIAHRNRNMLPPTTHVGSAHIFSFLNMPPPPRKTQFERIFPQAPPPRPSPYQPMLPPAVRPRPCHQVLPPAPPRRQNLEREDQETIWYSSKTKNPDVPREW